MRSRRGTFGRRAFLAGAATTLFEACGPSRPPSPRPAPARGEVTPDRLLPLPARRADAPSGSAFSEDCGHLGPADREAAVAREILAGNVPSFLRRLAKVDVDVARGGSIWVTSDYLAVGSDEDFVRVPMAKRTAHEIARTLGCVLPTPKIVDLVYAAATCKVTSPAHGASARMASSELFAAHSREIEERRAALGCPAGSLVAGPKKDLVITAREAQQPGRLAIYGWFHGDGTPIQPLSLLHSDKYVDFSHGIRLVADEMTLDGRARSVFEVLADPGLAALLSDEGAFTPLD